MVCRSYWCEKHVEAKEEMMGTTTSKREGKSLLAPVLWVLAAVGLTTSPVLGQSSARQPQNVILSEAKDLLFFPTWSHDPGLVRNKQSAFSLVLGASRKPASATFLNPLRATNINDRTWRMPTSFSGMAERFTMISGKGPWSSILGGSTGPSFPLNRGGWSDRAASLLSGRSASVATGPLTFTCPSGGTCWVGGASGNWSNASNWSNGVPTSATNALIDNNNANGQGASSVTLDIGGAQTLNLTVDSDDSLGFANATSLTVNGTSITNNGAMSINSGGNTTELIIGGSNVTLSGTGTLTMGNSSANFITGSVGTNTLNNKETIQGAGNIGDNQMTLGNSGTINANAGSGQNVLYIQTSGGTTNTGTLEATNGSTLSLYGNTFTYAGGTIKAIGAGALVNLQSGVTITGGTLTDSGGGIIEG